MIVNEFAAPMAEVDVVNAAGQVVERDFVTAAAPAFVSAVDGGFDSAAWMAAQPATTIASPVTYASPTYAASSFSYGAPTYAAPATTARIAGAPTISGTTRMVGGTVGSIAG